MDLEITYVTGDDGLRHLTIPEQRRQEAIAFVRDLASKPAAEIASVVSAGHDDLMRALDGVTDAQAAYKPAPEEWNVLELMAHVVTVKRIMGALGPNLAKGELPPGFGPQFEEERAQDGVTAAKFETVAAARAAAEEAHASMLKFIATLDGDVNTELRFKHFVFGEFNAPEWAAFQRVHDANHAPQLLEIKASFPAD